MSARFACALSVVALLLSPPVSAQTAGKRYALLVGVKDYEHDKLSDLSYTENDVEELAKVLKAAGYADAVVLTTTRGKADAALRPTAKNIREQLKKISAKITKH